MANARYNVTCPSCDADVPVRSTSASGTKIECPKCKYRFTCPPPPDGGDDDDAVAAKPAKKAAKKGGSTVLIGAVLGVLAVLVLIGGAIFILGDSDEQKPVAKTSTTPVTPPRPVQASDPGDPGQAQADPAETPTETPPSDTGAVPEPGENGNAQPAPTRPPEPTFPAPGVRSAVANRPSKGNLPEITNLLPGDTTAVYQLNVAQAVKTPVHAAFLDQNIRDLFQESFFFPAETVTTYIHAVVGPERNPFVVVRTESPIDDKVMVDLMGSNLAIPRGSPVRGRFFFLMKSNRFVRAASGAFTPEAVLGVFGVRLPAEKKPQLPDRPLAFHFYDEQTIVLTTEPTMERFLADLQPNGFPPFKTDVADGTGSPAADPNAAAGRRLLSSIRNYQTIEPELKRILNDFEQPEEGKELPPVALYAEMLDQRILSARKAGTLAAREVPEAAGLIESVRLIGACLNTFTKDRLYASVSLEFNTDNEAKIAAHQKVIPAAYPMTWAASVAMNSQFFLYNAVSAPPAASGVQSFPVGLVPNGGSVAAGPDIGNPAALAGSGGFGGSPIFSGGPSIGFRGGPPPGVGGPPPGVGGPPSGFRGGPPPGVGGPPPGVGRPSFSPDDDESGSSGFVPSFGGSGGFGQYSMNRSILTLSTTDRTLKITAIVNWQEDWFAENVLPPLNRTISRFRGAMGVLSGQTETAGLATGLAKMTARKEPFPQGALPRDPQQERFRLPYPPEQRVSFLADLLPFIGKGGLRTQIQDRQAAWYDKVNLNAAEAWVPEFLVPNYPPDMWRATHPLAENRSLGGTNFVGLAGVGRDAARYNPRNNPDHAKKVGITGYEWGSKIDEIIDGLSNTAFMIQAPPNLPRPWIAGGGATLVGVDDSDDAFKPFATPIATGKRGAHVLMADGSVRFVAEGIDPKVFKGMVTRAGGEDLGELDQVAPRVSAETELRGAAFPR